MNIGQPAPELSGIDDTGKQIRSKDMRGKWVVLYFYPKDNTMGCSLEAQKFEQLLPEFHALGAEVIGVSTDSNKSHASFRAKCNLSFALLADTDKKLSLAYGVPTGFLGAIGGARQTFLIDPDGNLAHIWRFIPNPLSHALEVKRELEKRLAAKAVVV
ncbi:MAG: peroxiredoxin [Deinococcales bacterium]